MNKNFNKIPENILEEINNLISDSGMSKEEFVQGLIIAYDINSEANNYDDLLKGYNIYCDSFIG